MCLRAVLKCLTCHVTRSNFLGTRWKLFPLFWLYFNLPFFCYVEPSETSSWASHLAHHIPHIEIFLFNLYCLNQLNRTHWLVIGPRLHPAGILVYLTCSLAWKGLEGLEEDLNKLFYSANSVKEYFGWCSRASRSGLHPNEQQTQNRA
jgi:hypothetical protein